MSAPVRATEPPARERIALAALRGRAGETIECTVEGTSMHPTIPAGASVRVRPLGGAVPAVGDVVAVAVRDRIITHRVIRAADRRGHLLTRGDAALLPDPPVALEWILGRVVEARVGGTGGPVGPPPPRPALRSAISRTASALVALLMRLSLPLSDRAAHLMIRAAGALTVRTKEGPS